MSQHNRKDPRAKVLSMTVRYRSATLSEFIEHHSYDVSRGGLFIKTPSPFPPGTLLKFEVKIAEDQRVMQGVGRVVWKRDTQVNHEEPAGMGIKFIKLDDASKAVIEQLVKSRGDDTVSAFDRSPDSKSYQTFPSLEDTLSEDPTVVRTRADLFPADLRSHLETPGSGVNQNLSIPVPSGPALSLSQGPVSLPQELESAPISQQMTVPGGLMSPVSVSGAARPPATSGGVPSGAPAPGSGPMVPLASPIAHLSSPPVSVTPERASKKPAMSEAPYRKPGPLPVHSAPPPKSNLGYLLLVVVALGVGGAFLYLRMNPELLHSRPSGTPTVAPPQGSRKTNSQPVDSQPMDSQPMDRVDAPLALPAGQDTEGAKAAPEPTPAGLEAPTNTAPAAEVPPSGTEPRDSASPSGTSPTEAAAAAVAPTTPAPAVTPRPVVRKAKPKAAAVEASPEAPAAKDEPPSEPAPASEAPAPVAPAEPPPATTPAPSPAPPTPQPSSEEEFR